MTYNTTYKGMFVFSFQLRPCLRAVWKRWCPQRDLKNDQIHSDSWRFPAECPGRDASGRAHAPRWDCLRRQRACQWIWSRYCKELRIRFGSKLYICMCMSMWVWDTNSDNWLQGNKTYRDEMLVNLDILRRNITATEIRVGNLTAIFESRLDRNRLLPLIEGIRWPGTLGLLILFLIFNVVLFYAVARHSRCSFIT